MFAGNAFVFCAHCILMIDNNAMDGFEKHVHFQTKTLIELLENYNIV